MTAWTDRVQREAGFSSVVRRGLTAVLCVFAFVLSVSISLEEMAAGISYLLFLYLLARRDIRFRGGALIGPLAALVLGGVLTALLVSRHPAAALREKLSDLWMAPIAFVLMAWATTEHRRRLWWDFFMGGVLLAAVYGVFQALTGIDFLKPGRLIPDGRLYRAWGFSGLYLTYGGLMAMAACLLWGNGFAAEGWRRPMRLVTAVMATLACLLSFSRSAMTGLVAGVAALVVGAGLVRRWKTVALLPLLGSVLLVVTVFSAAPEVRSRMTRFLSFRYMQEDTRMILWRSSLKMALSNPLWGVGSEQDYQKRYAEYHVGPRPVYYPFPFPHSHNDILQSWLSGGLLGLAGYLTLFGILVVRGWTRLREGPQMLGLFAAVIAMFVQGWSQCYFTDAENAWLFWSVAGWLHAPAADDKAVPPGGDSHATETLG